MKEATKRMLRKFVNIDKERMNHTMQILQQESGKSKVYILCDMALNYIKYGSGYTDYFRSNFIALNKEEKKTFVTARSFYKIMHYLNDYHFTGIFHNKIIFDKIFKEYLKREFLDLNKATEEEFAAFLQKHPVVFAKIVDGECSDGVDKVVSADVKDPAALYHKLIENKQMLIEEGIVQIPEINEINGNAVNPFRVSTVVKDGKAYVVGNAMRINLDDSEVIKCQDMFFEFGEDGRISSNVIDNFGVLYDNHPLTGKAFSEVYVKDVKAAFELCCQAALEVPQVRYVGWDVGFSEKGPCLIEGNEFPAYGMFQFHKLHNQRTGHWKDIADVIGEEAGKVPVGY